jgi:hypothetical protein
MSRRSHATLIFTASAAFLLAAFLTVHLSSGRAMAWCLISLMFGVSGGVVLGLVLDEYWPPSSRWWRRGRRRGW